MRSPEHVCFWCVFWVCLSRPSLILVLLLAVYIYICSFVDGCFTPLPLSLATFFFFFRFAFSPRLFRFFDFQFFESKAFMFFQHSSCDGGVLNAVQYCATGEGCFDSLIFIVKIFIISFVKFIHQNVHGISLCIMVCLAIVICMHVFY